VRERRLQKAEAGYGAVLLDSCQLCLFLSRAKTKKKLGSEELGI
jgi:hypothetical protein